MGCHALCWGQQLVLQDMRLLLVLMVAALLCCVLQQRMGAARLCWGVTKPLLWLWVALRLLLT